MLICPEDRRRAACQHVAFGAAIQLDRPRMKKIPLSEESDNPAKMVSSVIASGTEAEVDPGRRDACCAW